MNWVIKIVVPEYTTYDGISVERHEETFEIPFECCQTVWYVHRKNWCKRNSEWVITKSKITGVWATNCIGVTLDNNDHIAEDNFDRLFTDRKAAIDECLKRNECRKVKIYGE
jgi:hypothetical protein